MGSNQTQQKPIYYFGGSDNHHGISSDVTKSVTDFLILKIQTSQRMINIIQVYATTNHKPDEDVEVFYNYIDQLIRVVIKENLHY